MHGHKEKIKLFKDLFNKGGINHAYLFYGDRQIGKFSFAKLLANFIEYGEFKDLKKTLVDTIIINKNEEKIGIDEVRGIKKAINQKPLMSEKRLIIVNDSEKLTTEAQNSFLKFLEEPPSHAVFVFVSANPDSLFSTVRSRLTGIYFKRMSFDDLVDFLKKERDLSTKEAEKIALKSFGRIGRALDLLDNNVNTKKDKTIYDYVSENILKLYFEDKLKNANKIKHLLDKEKDLSRFNLNEKLQKKSIENILK